MDPHYHLFSSNAPLSAIEIPSVEEEIETRMAAIRTLELEVRRYRSLLSPIRSFPTEILGEIFTFTLASTQGIPNTIPIPTALIALCLVCTAWRNAALSTPQLWDTVEVHPVSQKGPPIDVHRIRRWLERSKTAPKTVILDAGTRCFHGGFSCVLRNKGVVKLLKEGPAIFHLIINIPTGRCLNQLAWAFNLDAYDLPSPSPWAMVKRIEVNSPMLHLPSEIGISQRCQTRYPMVDTLIIDSPFNEDDVELVHENKHVAILLGGLAHFSFTFDWPFAWDERLLDFFTSLRTLALKIAFSDSWLAYHEQDDSLAFDLPPFTLPNLQALRVHGGLHVDKKWYAQFLRMFQTPALVELDLGFESNDRSPSDREELRVEIVDLMRRSDCRETLARLTMHSISISVAGLERLLRELPALTHLTLDCVAFDSGFFRQPEVMSLEFMPRLQVLNILRLDRSFVYTDLHGFLKSRVERDGSPNGHGRQLKQVKVELSSGWVAHPNESPDVRKVRSAGVDLQLTTGAYL